MIYKELKIKINSSNTEYPIIIGDNLLNEVDKFLNLKRKFLIVADDNIKKEYIDKIKSKMEHFNILVINHGEENKNFDNYKIILETLLKNNFKRTDAIVSIGGGMIGDMSAFAASTYMRGIDFYNIPTTLLSQVDSSIGGKTAINFGDIKNIVGTFYQPKAVIIDVDTLRSLPKRELNSGLVESIKMAATLDKEFFDFLKVAPKILDNAEYIIYHSLLLKKNIVENDEKEKGLRKVLNFGHTIGHAIEENMKLTMPHGECVGIGMLYFSSDVVKNDIKNILTKYELPTSCNFNKEEVIELIKHDKKANNDTISTVYVEKIGDFKFNDLTIDEIKKLIY